MSNLKVSDWYDKLMRLNCYIDTLDKTSDLAKEKQAEYDLLLTQDPRFTDDNNELLKGEQMKPIDVIQEHTIEVKIPFKRVPNILLLWEDGTQHTIPVLSKVRGIKKNNKRPSGFWYDPNQPTYGVTREEFMQWIHNEFYHIFDKDSQIFKTHLAILDYRGQ